ncbi:complement factor H-like [Xenentodon cancila]
MKMATKTCVLLLWIQTLTFVKSQECTLQQFLEGAAYDSKFDTTVLEAVYPAGKQVRVPCITGYTGFFKLICTEGNWKTVGAKCQPKSCGHPGDAQFADFNLENGDDFVFGSKVVYTCQNGFQMVSRTNYRRCMAEGWDGVVPVCEAQKCPLIHVSNKVQVIGDLEEATFGNVIRFSCKSNNDILIGATEIYCDERGQWSGDAPECKVITCETPVIEHGSVRDALSEYKENEILNFYCDDDYKRTDERLPRCTKVGGKATWSPTPGCKIKTCELELQAGHGTTYIPASKSVFLPGSTLQVICAQTYWIVDTQTTTAEVTCKNNGEWSIRPVCKEVICQDPQDNSVDWFYVSWGRRRLDDTAQYSCRSGFEKPRGTYQATCSRAGWRPNPLCQRLWCIKPDIENARITYNNRNTYSNGDILRYTCISDGERTYTLTCERGIWTGLESCSADGVLCSPPPRVDNAVVTTPYQMEYLSGSTVTYECRDTFVKEGEDTIRCTAGKWEQTNISCNAQCNRLEDEKLTVKSSMDKDSYKNGEVIEYECIESDGVDEGTATCVDGKWNKTVECQGIPCIVGEKHPALIVTGSLPVNGKVKVGEKLLLECKEPYLREGSQEIECLETGEWNLPFPNCSDPSGCQAPPPLADGDVKDTVKPHYDHNESVEYICQHLHILEGTRQKTCVNGAWIGEMKCLKPCTVNQSDMDARNIRFERGNRIKMYAEHEDHITFACKRGRRVGTVAFRQQCVDGVMALPTCE